MMHFKVIPKRHRNLPVSTERLWRGSALLPFKSADTREKKKKTTLANALLKDRNRSFPDC